MSIYGLRIIFDTYANEATTKRLVPESRYRSKRILKKLLIRFGSEYRMQPCMWRHRDTIFAHPSLRAQAATRGQL